jgi:hypothetical protein
MSGHRDDQSDQVGDSRKLGRALAQRQADTSGLVENVAAGALRLTPKEVARLESLPAAA